MRHRVQYKTAGYLLAGILWIMSEAFGNTEVPIRQTGRYVTANWWVRDGLPFDQVRDITQRKNGFLWVATVNGAARFDGVLFETFNTRNAPELVNNAIRSLFEDSREHLWLGHDSGDITIRSGDRFFPVTVPEDWPKVPVIGFVEDPAGTVWAMNRLGDRLPVYGLQGGEKRRKHRHIKSIATGGGRIVSVAKDRITDYSAGCMPNGIPLEGYYGYAKAFPGRENSLWVLSHGRLQRWDGNAWTENLGLVPWTNSQNMALLETRQGNIVAGTPENGLFIFDRQGGIEHLTRNNGIGHDRILCLYEDREGTVWAGTSAGLTAIRPRRVGMIYPAETWKYWIPLSISPRAAGGVWVGTDGDGLFSLDQQHALQIGDVEASPVVHVVLEDRQGSVWLNSRQGFLCRVGDTCSTNTSIPRNHPVTALYEGYNDILWAGGQHRLWRWDGNAWRNTLPENHGISDIRCITGDSQGTIWFGTAAGGLGRLYRGSLEQYGNMDGLPSEYIHTLYFDQEDDTLWIGTGGGGLTMWTDEQFFIVPDPLDILGNVIFLILDDHQGRLWLITNHGLFVADKESLKQAATGEIPFMMPMQLDFSDGLPPLSSGNRVHSACRAEDGTLYFASNHGIITADPDQVQRRDELICPTIKTLLANNQNIPLSTHQTISLSPGVNRLDFSFTALSFIAPHRIRFMYRLVGYNSEWIHSGSSRIVNYRHIPAGSYRFEVRACNSDGVWNPRAAAAEFTIQPFFWETWWFKALPLVMGCLIAAALSLEIAERINRKKLIRAERLRAVEQERTRISMDIHDEIGAGLTQISLLSHLIAGNGNSSHSAYVGELKQVSNRLVRSLDEIVWVITPKNDTLDSLAAYLTKYVREYLRETDIRCDLDVPIELPDRSVSGPVRHHLFLVVKESLNNIVKHAEATEVTFTMTCRESFLSILIYDNGKGICSEEKKQRFRRGLKSMPDRMKTIGGTFDITSNKSGGTTVRLSLQL